MADKPKKEATPPPLLLMPAGGGLTLTPPDQPNVLMPVIQAEPSLFGPEDEGLGEADSFVGQSPPQPSMIPASSATSSMFPSTGVSSGSDPFAQVNQGGTPMRPPVGPTSGPMTSHGATPLIPTSQVTHSSAPMAAVPPMPNAGGLAGLYRKHGSSRYAQMPAGIYANSGPPGPSPANLMSGPPAPTPFTSNFSDVATLEPTQQPGPPPTLPPQPSLGPMSGMGYVPSAVGIYVPVASHWCFCKNVEGRDIWYPFSMSDNLALEDALKSVNIEGRENVVVSTDGGRYDVNVIERRRYAVYWEEAPQMVQRCNWFFKREGDNRYVPYDEDFCAKLEDEYRSAVTTGVWHKPLQLETGETIVMHNPNVMVHYRASSQPDEWGNVQGDQMRPRVMKRGMADFESIEEGESRQVDHLVFVVHGIGSVCDIRFRNIIECVDDFRTISQSLLGSHFTQHVEVNKIGRVEYLPIQWHTALHGDATGIDRRLKAITLPSTGKLRNFVNDTLMDVLFYTSPTYCQCIADTVGNEINRLYELFLSRNPYFQGEVSVAGHSLGSCILFDLLQHQGDQMSEFSSPDLTDPVMTNGQSELTPAGDTDIVNEDGDGSISGEQDVPPLSLEDLLSRVGLTDKKTLFDEEQIDMDALTMLSDGDLKDLGLPMGPRKKLQGILKEERSKKDKQKLDKTKREQQDAEKKLREKLVADLAVQQQQQQQHLQNGGSSTSVTTVNYLQSEGGTGHARIRFPQLKFEPVCCFALGSPMGLFMSARGVEMIGDDFRMPTCSKYFNIFHPLDPVAYRLEPLINPSSSTVKPVQMPHYKGRKRMHLELKENLARMGSDLKQKIIDSVKSTWASINSFARAHTQSESGQSLEQQVESEMSQVVRQLEEEDTASIASNVEEEIYMGQLNEGRRVDFVLQERPIESFNDYMFSLTSHGCYWNSEDTVLLVLREIYALYGITPVIPGTDPAAAAHKLRAGPPPKTPSPMGLPQMSSGPPQTMPAAHGPMEGNYRGYPSTAGFTPANIGPPPVAPQMYGVPNTAAPQRPVVSNVGPPSGPPPFSVAQLPQQQLPRQPVGANFGPPPMGGFVRKS